MYNRKTNDKLSTANTPEVPLADQVDECPPHFWFLEDGWQECRKCNTRSKIMRYEASDGWSPRNPIKKKVEETPKNVKETPKNVKETPKNVKETPKKVEETPKEERPEVA